MKVEYRKNIQYVYNMGIFTVLREQCLRRVKY